MMSRRSDDGEWSISINGVTNEDASTAATVSFQVCPPPPCDDVLSEEMIGKLIVPSPIWGSQETRSPDTSGRPTPSPVQVCGEPSGAAGLSSEQMESLLKVIEDSCKKTAEQVTEYCRGGDRRRSSLGGSQINLQSVQTAPAPGLGQLGSLSQYPTSASFAGPTPQTTITKQMSDAEKLRKVILELVDTERTYVKVGTSPLRTFFVFSSSTHCTLPLSPLVLNPSTRNNRSYLI